MASLGGDKEDTGESQEVKELRRRAKEKINKNHDLEMEDLENDDDLVNGGMNLKYELLEGEDNLDIDEMIEEASNQKETEKGEIRKVEEMDDDKFFNQFVEDILGKDEETNSNNTASIRLGRRRRNRGSEEALESKEVNEFLDEIAKMEKREEPLDEQKEEKETEQKEGNKRDIYIQQKDQYFVDDEEVYLNELETDHCNWENIQNLFKVITDPHKELIDDEDSNRDTILLYFHDICTGLLNSRSEDFLSFVYSSPEVMDSLIEFVAFEGVQKVLEKVLNLIDSINNLNSFRFLKHRFGLYRRVLREILSSDDSEKTEQLTRVFIQLVKEKNSIIDANYFIDKILLDNDNHVDILEKVVKERNVLLAELASLMIKRVVPEEERGFLEENSVREINKNFGRRD